VILRRLKAILVTAVLWGVAWLPPGVLFGLYLSSRTFDDVVMVEDGKLVRQPLEIWPMVARISLIWSLWGAAIGVLFALGVLIAERRHSLREISTWRFAVLGGAAAGVLPTYILIEAMRHEVTPDAEALGIILLVVLYGAGIAVAMLRAAQRGLTTDSHVPLA